MDEPWELDQLIKFNEEGLNDLDLDLQSWGLSLDLSQLHQYSLEVHTQSTIELLVPDLFNIEVHTNCDSESCLLCDFMHVLDDLNNLRHDDNLLYDLLEDVWDLYDSLDGGVDWHDSFLIPIDYLSLGLDVVLDVLLDDQSFLLYDLVLANYDFLDLSVTSLHCHDLLLKGMNFFDLLMDNRDFNGFLPNGFDDLVDVDDDWDFNGQFDQLRHLDKLLVISFHLIDLGNFVVD